MEGERGCFAGAGGAGDQEEPARPAAERLGDFGQTDLLECEELGRDQPQDDRQVAALAEDGDPEPPGIAEGEAEVGPALLLNLLLVAVRVMDFMSETVSSGSRTLVSSDRSRPWSRSTGGRPTVRWMSDAFRLIQVSRRRSM